MNGVLRHFRQFYSHIVTVYACDRYYHIALSHQSTVPQTTRTRYLTQSHYPNTRPTSPRYILLLLSAKIHNIWNMTKCRSKNVHLPCHRKSNMENRFCQHSIYIAPHSESRDLLNVYKIKPDVHTGRFKNKIGPKNNQPNHYNEST